MICMKHIHYMVHRKRDMTIDWILVCVPLRRTGRLVEVGKLLCFKIYQYLRTEILLLGVE